MKYLHLTYSLLISLMIISPVCSAADELKIGVVQIPVLLKNSPQAKLARDKIETEFGPREAKIIAMQKKAKSLDEKLTKDVDVMSKAERQKIERSIIELNRDIKRAKEEFTEDLNLRRNDEVRKLQRSILEAVRAIAKKENYDVVLDESVVYASNRVNLTKKVLQRLQDESAAGAKQQ